MRPVDSVGGAFPSDAACLRFNMIREQTIPCVTRIDSERNLLCGDYTERGVINSGLEVVGILFTGANKMVRIEDSDDAESVVQS